MHHALDARHAIVTACVVATLAACSGGETSSTGPSTTPGDTLRVVGGPAACDSCGSLTLVVDGPRASTISATTFVNHDVPTRYLDASTVLEPETAGGTSRMRLNVTFASEVPVGDYDLRLVARDDSGRTVQRTVGRALMVTRAWPGPPAPVLGRVELLVNVQGQDPDSDFVARVLDVNGNPLDAFDVRAGTMRSSTVVAGTRTVSLVEVAPNCTVAPPSAPTVVVLADQATPVQLTVSCVRWAVVLASWTVTAGEVDPDTAIVTCNGGVCGAAVLRANGAPVVLRAGPGTVDVRANLPPNNCTLSGSNPVRLTLASGDTTRVQFSTACTFLTGALRISLRVTGAAPSGPLQARVGDNPDCAALGGYLCDYTTAVNPGAPAVLRLNPRTWYVGVESPPPNCTVTAITPEQVTVSLAATSDVAIDLACN